MFSFLAWYFLATAIGWLTFPLAWRLLPALSDRGYSLARVLGLLVWGYVFWMLVSLGVIRNDGAGLLLTLLVLAAVSGSGLVRRERREALIAWLKSHLRLIVTVELLFFLAFALMAFIRAGNPDLSYTEKPMELAFINAILRSPTFPPPDPWLSGYAISYYYFGYVITAMLAKFTATPGSVAFNLMFSLIFALSASGAYGILHDLLAAWRPRPVPAEKPSLGWALFGPLFLLIVSNFEGLLEILHRHGLFWKFNPDGSATSSFWQWLDLKELSDAPQLPLGWIPDRGNWIWRASRVITEHNLSGQVSEIIDEFPLFSYLHGDLHPHVLAMPFMMLAVAAALNLFLGGWKGETVVGRYRLPLAPGGFFFGALMLGGLAFLNTWDILPGFALLVGAFMLSRASESGWGWERLKETLIFGLPLGLLAILLYLPFYAGFSSQAGGISPNLESPTRGVQMWIMFGPLLLPIFAYLIYLWRSEKRPADLWKGLGFGLGIALLLWIGSWGLALLGKLRPDLGQTYLDNLGGASAALYFGAATMRRLSYIGGLVTLLVILIPTLGFLVKLGPTDETLSKKETPSTGPIPTFVLMLVLLGTLLVMGPDFVYLRDAFGDRMNTVFKFYYQAWMLWSLAAAFGVAVILQKLKAWKGAFIVFALIALLGFLWAGSRSGDLPLGIGIVALVVALGLLGAVIWLDRDDWRGLGVHAGLGLVLFAALIYTVLGLSYKTGEFGFPDYSRRLAVARESGDPDPSRTAASVWTLDGTAFARLYYPDDMAAVDWLQTAPAGVIVEATDPGASYRFEFGMVSTMTGMPTVLGWPGHEGQWRAYELQGSRLEDIQRLYETRDWDQTLAILRQYNIRYVYVGSTERSHYSVYDAKFKRYLIPVFEQGQVAIYEVPGDELP